MNGFFQLVPKTVVDVWLDVRQSTLLLTTNHFLLSLCPVHVV